MARIPFIKFIPGIAWFLILFVLMVTPGRDFPEVGNWFGELSFDKIIHVGVFAVLCFLFMYPIAKSSMGARDKSQYFIRIAIAACIWGLTIEFIQKFFVPTRSFELMDWGSDSVGAAVAYLFCRKKFLQSARQPHTK